MTTEPAFLQPEPELIQRVSDGLAAHLVAIGRRLPAVEIEHDCLRYVEASIEAEVNRGD